MRKLGPVEMMIVTLTATQKIRVDLREETAVADSTSLAPEPAIARSRPRAVAVTHVDMKILGPTFLVMMLAGNCIAT